MQSIELKAVFVTWALVASLQPALAISPRTCLAQVVQYADVCPDGNSAAIEPNNKAELFDAQLISNARRSELESAHARLGELRSTEDFVRLLPENAKFLMQQVDLASPELEVVSKRYSAGDCVGACKALVEYYRGADTAQELRLRPIARSPRKHPVGEKILQDLFAHKVSRTRGEFKQPREADGTLDWHFGSDLDDQEWRFSMNRHYFGPELVEAFAATGNPKYPACWDALIRDWITACPPPQTKVKTEDWREHECGYRLRFWPQVFFGLQESPEFSEAARLMMLTVLVDHMTYTRLEHRKMHNFLSNQMHGLAVAAIAFPEFRCSTPYLHYARRVMTQFVDEMVYPDGTYAETTSFYALNVSESLERFGRLMQRAQVPMPAGFDAAIARMLNYSVYSMKPDGTNPLDGDSSPQPVAKKLLDFDGQSRIQRFDRPDWQYILTYAKGGTAPQGPPSRAFPWGGILVSRDGWGRDAQWSYFDFGPFGIAHQHRDMLHLSVSVGRDVLIDPGAFPYSGPIGRNFTKQYARHSRGHNVILIDGAGQLPNEEIAKQPKNDQIVITDAFDFAIDRFENGFEGVDGEATHERAVLYRRGKYWLVIDRIETDRRRQIEALWHFDRDCTVRVDGGQAVSVDHDVGNVRIISAGEVTLTPSMISGQKDPPQGWTRPTDLASATLPTPAPTAVFEGKSSGSSIFGWLIIPGIGVPAEGTLTLSRTDTPDNVLKANVHVEGLGSESIQLRMLDKNGRPPKSFGRLKTFDDRELTINATTLP